MGLRGIEGGQPNATEQVQQKDKQPPHPLSVRGMPVSSPPTLFGFGGLRLPPAADGGQRRWCVPVPPGQVVRKVVVVVHALVDM